MSIRTSLLSLLLVTTSGIYAAENLLVNGNFEKPNAKNDAPEGWSLEAAELLGLSIFHPALLALKEKWSAEEMGEFYQDMEDALLACKPS